MFPKTQPMLKVVHIKVRPRNLKIRAQCAEKLWANPDPFAVFAGKDPSRALATSSLKPEDCVPEWDDLDDKHKTVLDEWFTFFSKRYNVVGKVSAPKSPKL